MISSLLKERFAEIEKLAYAAGLRPYDIHYFEVPASTIYEIASYGLPTRYSHWSFGRVYQHQKAQGEMGSSKIFELILNCDPSYAFLDNNNTDTINLMICAHCIGHSSFFKNNVMFVEANEPNMVEVAKRHADIIDQYKKDYGDEVVDDFLDVALALERHIDVYKKLKRSKYPKRHVEFTSRNIDEWEDLVPNKDPLVSKNYVGNYLPPKPEKDLVWFLSEYSNLEDWQKNILCIVRRESYYFYPQYRTKIINEGWASYWHAELMHQYAMGDDNDYGCKGMDHPLTSEEHLDFLASHEKVVQPGLKFPLKIEVPEMDPMTGLPTGRRVKQWHPQVAKNPQLFYHATRVNPYYVGFKMFRDIKERWDQYYEDGFMEDEWGNKIEVTINGNEKIREVMESEDDVSFFRNYLTDKLAAELKLFVYGSPSDYDDNYDIQENITKRISNSGSKNLGKNKIDDQLIINKTVQVRTKGKQDIIAAVAKKRNNYGVPCIVIRRVDADGTLRLEHVPDDKVNVDLQYARSTLYYIYTIWGRPVEMVRKDLDVTRIVRYDSSGFTVDHEAKDYPESIENNDLASSW